MGSKLLCSDALAVDIFHLKPKKTFLVSDDLRTRFFFILRPVDLIITAPIGGTKLWPRTSSSFQLSIPLTNDSPGATRPLICRPCRRRE